MTNEKPLILSLKISSLFIFPALLFFFTLKLDNNLSRFNQRSYDPEYPYLISGITLGSGKLNVGHKDHPGTPVQLIIAISTRIQHLITGEEDYLTDVFSRPGQYIQTASYVFLSIVVLLLALSGFLIFKATSNIFLALFIQTGPFLYQHVMVDFTRLTPDSLMIIPVIIFSIYSIFYIQKKEQTDRKDIVGFAIISGLGLAFKLNFISFWIIPVILIKGWKNKGFYVLASLAIFLIFGFTLLFDLKFLWSWIKSLFLHSGSYGMGEANVIEWPAFLENLNLIIKNYWLMFLTMLLSIINLVIHVIKKKINIQNQIYRMLLGSVICVFFHTVMVSKHFAFRYMYNVLYATPFILYLNVELIAKDFRFKKKRLLYFAGIVLSIFLLIDYNSYLNSMIVWRKDITIKKEKEYNTIQEKVKNAPFVIIPNNYDLMFEKRGIIFGCAFAGGHKDIFQEKLVAMAPDFYLAEPTSNKFWHWMEQISPNELKMKYNDFYLFVGKDHIDNKELFLSKIGCEYKLEELYTFQNSGDRLFLTRLID